MRPKRLADTALGMSRSIEAFRASPENVRQMSQNVRHFACQCARENCQAPKHKFQSCSETATIAPFPGSGAVDPEGWVQSVRQPGALLCPSCAESETMGGALP